MKQYVSMKKETGAKMTGGQESRREVESSGSSQQDEELDF